MKLKVKESTTTTSISCTAAELRQSTSLSDRLTNTLRRIFNGPTGPVYADYTADEEDESNED